MAITRKLSVARDEAPVRDIDGHHSRIIQAMRDRVKKYRPRTPGTCLALKRREPGTNVAAWLLHFPLFVSAEAYPVLAPAPCFGECGGGGYATF